MKKKLLVTAATIGLCLAMLTGCGGKDGGDDDGRDPNGTWITLNKADEDDELLCEVYVPDEYTYDDVYSNPEDGFFYLDYEDGGYISILNEAYYPLYFYLSGGELPTEDEYSDYECDIDVIGTAFGGSDCMLIEETYYDATNKVDYEEHYLAMEYSDGGYIEYLVVYFADMDIDSWSDSDFLQLARDLFGK